MGAATGIAEWLSGLMESVAPVREAATGYKASLEAAGFPADVAAEMARSVHDVAVDMLGAALRHNLDQVLGVQS